MKLSRLEPQFVRYETRTPNHVYASPEYLRHVDSLAEAQGVQFLCPACFVRNGGAVGTHRIEVSFSGCGVKDNQGSHNREGKPSRWNATGSSYDDLTTKPSVLIDPALPACPGWHGFITNGEIE